MCHCLANVTNRHCQLLMLVLGCKPPSTGLQLACQRADVLYCNSNWHVARRLSCSGNAFPEKTVVYYTTTGVCGWPGSSGEAAPPVPGSWVYLAETCVASQLISPRTPPMGKATMSTQPSSIPCVHLRCYT
jgi:hypothetical protein